MAKKSDCLIIIYSCAAGEKPLTVTVFVRKLALISRKVCLIRIFSEESFRLPQKSKKTFFSRLVGDAISMKGTDQCPLICVCTRLTLNGRSTLVRCDAVLLYLYGCFFHLDVFGMQLHYHVCVLLGPSWLTWLVTVNAKCMKKASTFFLSFIFLIRLKFDRWLSIFLSFSWIECKPENNTLYTLMHFRGASNVRTNVI